MTASSRASRPQVLVVQPDPIGLLDRYAKVLSDAGLSFRVVRPFAEEPLPDLLEEDGLIVLGGHMSANDDDDYPWLGAIRKLMQQALGMSRPTLGICLGAQLLSQTFGGIVVSGNRGLESGVVRVRMRPKARDDELFGTIPGPVLSGAMHGDMIRVLPPGAVWLGESEMYPHQAFRVGTCVWGVQFHPEVSFPSYRRWVGSFRHEDPNSLLRNHQGLSDFERLEDQVSASSTAIGQRFAEIIHERRGGGV